MLLSYEHPAAGRGSEPVDYVDPNIGTLSWKTWSTSPTVQLPHGMIEVDPRTTPGIGDKYLADKIFGFSTDAFTIMPTTGELPLAPAENTSEYDHDLEIATPCYLYAAMLEESEVEAACTVTEHAACFRFAFPGR